MKKKKMSFYLDEVDAWVISKIATVRNETISKYIGSVLTKEAAKYDPAEINAKYEEELGRREQTKHTLNGGMTTG